jgi:predicted MPP superfamily phosphohydrolase
MKKSAVVFFSVFFTFYGALNAYVFAHGWSALSGYAGLKLPFVVGFLFIATAFIFGRFLERRWISPVATGLVWVGSFWLAALLYFFLACLAVDLLRLAGAVFPALGGWISINVATHSGPILLAVVGAVLALLLVGHLNALRPRTLHLRLAIDKPVPGGSFTIAVASDLHLGTIVGSRRCEGIVALLNALKADLILLPGDIVDEDLGPVIRANLGETLRGLHARYGVYAATGNHEYIGGVEPAVEYLRAHGIRVLRDEAVALPCGVSVVGREDRSAGMGGRIRKDLGDILDRVEKGQPVILMDHQPFHLEEAVEAGIDLQLSGHTHHGQIWPLNYITKAVYEMSWGYLRKGKTHIYVSSGVGSWGPPVRIGNRPEVISIELVPEATGE